MRYTNKSFTALWVATFTGLLAACDGATTTSSTASSSSVVTTPSSSSQTSMQSSSSVAVSSSSQAPALSSSSSMANSSSVPIIADKPFIFGINAGGAALTLDGRNYMASNFGSGSPYSSTDPISNTTDDVLYQSELYGENITFEIPVENGDYDIELHFAELYQTANGSRVFSANVEGESAFNDLDLYMTEGHDAAYSVRLNDLAVGDETLSITLVSSVNNATISGISVYSSNGAFREPPPPPPTPRSSERPGTDCNTPAIPTSINNSRLPDPFTMLSGTKVQTKEQWRCRREEILRLAEENTHGVKPPPPAELTSSYANGRLTINVSDNGRSASFSVNISGANGNPGVIEYTLAGLGSPGQFFPSGVARITYDVAAVGNESGKTGAFYELYGSTHRSTGVLVAQAWGVSRIIDALEQQAAQGNTIVIPERVGVTGCSRLGKGAFVAGVFDARVALTMPMESGTGGSVSWRKAPEITGAQTLQSAFNEAPWLGDAFGRFVNSPERYPLDTHQLVGAVAPRGFLAVERVEPAHLATQASLTAVQAGTEVYEALGVEDHIMYVSTAPFNHCGADPKFDGPIRAMVRKFLFDEQANTGGIDAASRLEDMTRWIDWDTPTLTD